MPPQFTDVASLSRFQNLPEDRVPSFPHKVQQDGNIPFDHRSLGQHRVRREYLQVAGVQQVFFSGRLHFPGYDWAYRILK